MNVLRPGCVGQRKASVHLRVDRVRLAHLTGGVRTVLLMTLVLGSLAWPGCAGRKSEVARFVDMSETEAPPVPAVAPATPEPTTPAPTPAPSKRETRPARGRQEPVVVVPSRVLTGKVLRVNKSARFVVVVFPLGQMPAVDQRLSVYREGLKVGEIKISAFQRDDKAAADIVAGDAEEGDQVSAR